MVLTFAEKSRLVIPEVEIRTTAYTPAPSFSAMIRYDQHHTISTTLGQ
jgi:hypothetical protein